MLSSLRASIHAHRFEGNREDFPIFSSAFAQPGGEDRANYLTVLSNIRIKYDVEDPWWARLPFSRKKVRPHPEPTQAESDTDEPEFVV